MPTKLTPEGFETAVRHRLRAVRIARGLTFAAIRPRRCGYAAARLECQDGRLLLDTLFRLCRVYRIRPDLLLDGWAGWSSTNHSMIEPPVASDGELELMRNIPALVHEIRAQLVRRRHDTGLGTPSVALAVWGHETAHSTLHRLEAGDTKRPDAVEIYRLLLYYDTTFAELLGITPEVHNV